MLEEMDNIAGNQNLGNDLNSNVKDNKAAVNLTNVFGPQGGLNMGEQPAEGINDFGSILGDANDLFLQDRFADGNEVFEDIKEQVAENVKKFVKGSKILKNLFDVNVLSISKNNTKYGQLAYSTIVVVAKYLSTTQQGAVAMPFMLTKTGNSSVTVDDFVSISMENLNKSVNDRILFPTYVQAIDQDFYAIIGEHICELNLGKIDFHSAIIVDTPLTDKKSDVIAELLGTNIAELAINNMVASSLVNVTNTKTGTKGYSDFNFQEFVNSFAERVGGQGMSFKLAHTLTAVYPKLVQNSDKCGMEYRSDFGLRLDVQGSNVRATKSLNKPNNSFSLSNVSGFIESIPIQVQEADRTNPNLRVTKTKFIPQVVLTKAIGTRETLGNKLLAIATAYAVLSNKSYLHVLYTNLQSQTNTPKGVNVVIDNNENKIDLNNKSLSIDIVKNYLADIYGVEPILSYDAMEYGVSSFVDTHFIKAIGGDNTSANLILKAARELTNNNFPEQFDINNIFIREACVTIPVGSYFNKETNSFRDIRDVDFAYICNSPKTTDGDRYQWYLSCVGANQAISFSESKKGAVDSYEMRVHLLNKVGLTGAEIVGSATRVTFSADFIKTLVQALVQTGLRFTTSLPDLTSNTTFSGFGQTGDVFNRGQINSNVGGFVMSNSHFTTNTSGNNNRFMGFNYGNN